MSIVRVLCLLCLAAIVGCGGGPDVKSVEEPGPEDQIKSALQTVADSGVIDSGLVTVEEQLGELKETDAAKADELLADLNELQGLSGEAAKKKATEMIGKL